MENILAMQLASAIKYFCRQTLGIERAFAW
jgi:hypothetical protein